MDNEGFRIWWEKERKRNEHEWSKWDGSDDHGIAINNLQCDRIEEANKKYQTNYVKAFNIFNN
jgi:hypothetical protein